MQPVLSRARSTSAAFFVGGALLSSYGYLLTVRADVGNGPLFAVQDAIQQRSGMSLGLASVAAGLGMALLAAALRVRIQPGVLAIPLLSGVTIAMLEPFAPQVDGAVLQWGSFAVGTTVMMLGAVMMFGAGIGASPPDCVMFGLAKAVRTTPARARIAMEVAMAVSGMVLGGRVGLGTAIMAVSVGPLFAFWSRVLPGGSVDPRPADPAATDPAPLSPIA